MAITRRQFITRTGLAAAGSFFGQSLFRNPFLQQALAQTIGDRYFVVVFLDGGNDGLNTVTPIANGTSGNLRTAYQVARKSNGSGGIQLLSSELAATAIANDPNTQTPLALHPGFIGLKHLYDLGKVAVIQGCGYPDYSLSHDVARHSWQSGVPLQSGNGWMGRYLAANYVATDIPAVNIANEIAGEYIQNTTSVLAIRRLRGFGLPSDTYSDATKADMPKRKAALQGLSSLAAASAQATLRYTGDVSNATLTATTNYPPLSKLYQNDRASFNDQYSNLQTGFASDLREVAKVIYGVSQGVAGVNARFFELRNGGYDTHSDQGGGAADGQQYSLHNEIGNALEVFYHDCEDMGVANKLCVVIWSEFARRIVQNDNGTDHGSQGPMFVIGGAVNGGVYGNHPDIADPGVLNPDGDLGQDGNTPYSQAAGDPARSTDFRDVYGTLLKHWLGMPNPLTILPIDSGSPNTYWTSPNFDMGFI